MLHCIGYLELDRADVVKYLGYRTHSGILHNYYTSEFHAIMCNEHKLGHESLEYTFKRGMVIDGRKISRSCECTKNDLFTLLDMGKSIDFYLNLDNHDSIIYLLDDVWYLLVHSDGKYWLFSLEDFDVDAFNKKHFHEQIVIEK